MTEHPIWPAAKADGTPLTSDDLQHDLELPDDEPAELARMNKDEFDREVYLQAEIAKALKAVRPQARILQGKEAAKFMSWMHQDDCPFRRNGPCNCEASR